MKNIFSTILLCYSNNECSRQQEQSKSQIVEASCGQCQFGMEGHGCELAVRIDGKYFVDGTSSGDAHANDGFVLLSERHPLLAK
jgi:hypothetical protein